MRPVWWLGIGVAGVFIILGKKFANGELPNAVVKLSNYYLGICIAFISLRGLAPPFIETTTASTVSLLGNLILSLLSIRTLWRAYH